MLALSHDIDNNRLVLLTRLIQEQIVSSEKAHFQAENWPILVRVPVFNALGLPLWIFRFLAKFHKKQVPDLFALPTKINLT